MHMVDNAYGYICSVLSYSNLYFINIYKVIIIIIIVIVKRIKIIIIIIIITLTADHCKTH